MRSVPDGTPETALRVRTTRLSSGSCFNTPTWPAIGEMSTVPSVSSTATSSVSGRSAIAASTLVTSLSGDW